MPDHGERPAEEIERNLEVALYPNSPPRDYGSTLLEVSPPRFVWGRRILRGGIMFPRSYRSPRVEIRPPKWEKKKIWIRAENYPDAQFIADGVYHYTGRGPVHFSQGDFQYPPLRLATPEQLRTKEECLAYVESIAKGPAQLRDDYSDRVRNLLLQVVKSPEVERFLKNMRALALPEINTEATENGRTVPDGNEAAGMEENRLSAAISTDEAAEYHGEDDSEAQATPMEVDDMSLQAIQSVAYFSGEPQLVDPMRLQQFAESDTNSNAFVPSFEVDSNDSGKLLRSVRESLGANCNPSGQKTEDEDKTSSHIEGYLSALDECEQGFLSTLDVCFVLGKVQGRGFS